MRTGIRLVMLALTLFTLVTVSYGDNDPKKEKETKTKPLTGYTILLVDKFAIEKNAATEEFPAGQEVVMQKSSIVRLREKKAFDTVVDMTDPESDQKTGAPKRLQLSGTVVQYDKGSRAARWLVGLGAGATKVKVRFVFTDADTHKELFRVDRQGKFYGMVGFVGGSSEQATSEAAGDVVDGLIKEIKKNR